MSFSFIQLGSQTCAAMGLYNFPRLYVKCHNQHGVFFCVHPYARRTLHFFPFVSSLPHLKIPWHLNIKKLLSFHSSTLFHSFECNSIGRSLLHLYGVYCPLNYNSLRVCSHASPCLELLRQNYIIT